MIINLLILNAMKKIFLLFSILVCYSWTYAQSFTPSKATVESDEVVVINGTGESNTTYFTNVSIDPTKTTSSSPDASGPGWIFLGSIIQLNSYNIATQSPTSFTVKISNSHPANNYTITFSVITNIQSPGGQQTNVEKKITITVNHKPQIFYNDAKSQVFYKNDCGPGFQPAPYTYTVPANQYNSTTKADANAKAQAEINANGQTQANLNGQCLQLYYNTEKTGSFTKNNCVGENVPGAPITHTIAAGLYTGTSQLEADQKAQNALNTQGQAAANTQTSCVPFVYYKKLVMENVTVDPDVALQNADIYVEIYADASLTTPLAIQPNSITINYQEKEIYSAVGSPNPTTTLRNRMSVGYQGANRVYLGNFEIVNCPPVPSENKTKTASKGSPSGGGGGGNYPCITREYFLL
jgi:hypothetical protein